MCNIKPIAAREFETMTLAPDSFHAIFERSPDAMLVVDESGCISLSNPAAQALLGRKELAGVRMESLMPDRWRGNWRASLAAPPPALLTAQDIEIPVEISFAPINAGSPDTIVYLRDRRESAGLESQLIHTRNRLGTLLAAIPEIVTEVDLGKRYRWANSAGLAFFGDDMIGREASFYFVGEQPTYEAVSPLFEGKAEAVYVESWQRRRDGEPRLIAWQCRCMADPDGRITGAISSGRDITEARQNEDKLKQQRMLLDHMGGLAKIGGWEFDVLTMQGRWTDEVARIHDIEFSELTVSRGLSFYHGKYRKLIETSVQKAIDKGVPYDIELELVSAKGMRKWVRTRGVPVEIDGKVVRVEGLIQDITDLKRARESREESERAFESIFNA
nr:PAS domain-containing protein [Burkholderiales bacterium]